MLFGQDHRGTGHRHGAPSPRAHYRLGSFGGKYDFFGGKYGQGRPGDTGTVRGGAVAAALLSAEHAPPAGVRADGWLNRRLNRRFKCRLNRWFNRRFNRCSGAGGVVDLGSRRNKRGGVSDGRCAGPGRRRADGGARRLGRQ